MRMGIDVGGTKIEGIVMDSAGHTVARLRRDTPAAEGYQAVVEAIASIVEGLEAEVKTSCTVGLGTPGALSLETGLMKNCNAVCINGKPLMVDLETRLRRQVRLANDANCFTLSEAMDGAAAGKPVVFGVILGTGVGAGITFAGKVHNGPNSIAGEWGHNVLDAAGPPCYCGKAGCVETLLAGPSLLADYRRHGGELATDTTALVALASSGSDPQAQAAMDRYLDRFGRAMAAVINVLDPDAIVLGGGMSHVERLYVDGPAAVRRHIFSDGMLTPILRNQFGAASGVRGACMLW